MAILNTLTFVFDQETGLVQPFVSKVSIGDPVVNPETGLSSTPTILESISLADAKLLIQ